MGPSRVRASIGGARGGVNRGPASAQMSILVGLTSSNLRSISTEIEDDVKLKDLYTWN